jgi:FixJ family two-component response regulator
MASNRKSFIFVVDDDPAILHSTRFLLEGEGFSVRAFRSGLDLLEAFPGPEPRCVLLDQVMPGLPGLEVVGRLRDLDAQIPVILITGHPDPAIRTRARAVGIPLMEKPFVFETLLDMIPPDDRRGDCQARA